jgi:hypothetical protein
MGSIARASISVSPGSIPVGTRCFVDAHSGSLAGLRSVVPSFRLLVPVLGLVIVSLGSLVPILGHPVTIVPGIPGPTVANLAVTGRDLVHRPDSPPGLCLLFIATWAPSSIPN